MDGGDPFFLRFSAITAALRTPTLRKENVMTNTNGKGFRRKKFWVRQKPSGEFEYRKRSKAFFTILPFLLAALLYKLLLVIDGLENGPAFIVFLALSTSVLMVALILLVIIISLIEYLQKFE